MFVIGTAGHVDHGKSALVQALTGIDPDRLEEEKIRGMTIDLGFAHLVLPSGQEVGIVDVPGHEHFIKNMLAGVGGIDAVLLVVAADEGPMPQTREHLDIINLLGVSRGLAVITKKDLVDEAWLEMVREEVRNLLKSTTLSGAPIMAVSAMSGEGLEGLAAQLDEILVQTQPRVDLGRPRLPIDRVFSISGFGTVVTGTLLDGSLKVGQEVLILPQKIKSRIRGLQMFNRKVEIAQPGTRTAVNLTGVDVRQLERGDTLVLPEIYKATALIDARLTLLPGAKAIAHGEMVKFYLATTETSARVRLLEANELVPGGLAWAQLRLIRPVVAVRNDRFIIRRPSPPATIGGGVIIDPHPHPHRRHQKAVIDGLKAASQGSPSEVILQLLLELVFCSRADLFARSGLPSGEFGRVLGELEAEGEVLTLGNVLVAAATVEKWRQQIRQILRDYHQKNPLRPGLPRDELLSWLRIAPKLLRSLVERLAAEGTLLEEDKFIRLPDFQAGFSPEQEVLVESIKQEMAREPYSPPAVPELMERFGIDADFVHALVSRGVVKKVSEEIVFLSDAYEEMVKRIIDFATREGKINVAQVRDLFHTSRKYAVPLLEHLDAERITRRVDNDRVVVKR